MTRYYCLKSQFSPAFPVDCVLFCWDTRADDFLAPRLWEILVQLLRIQLFTVLDFVGDLRRLGPHCTRFTDTSAGSFTFSWRLIRPLVRPCRQCCPVTKHSASGKHKINSVSPQYAGLGGMGSAAEARAGCLFLHHSTKFLRPLILLCFMPSFFWGGRVITRLLGSQVYRV